MNVMGRTLACAGTALLAVAAGGLPAAAGASTDNVFVAGGAGWVATGVTAAAGDVFDVRADGQSITWLPPVFGGALSGPDGQSGECHGEVADQVEYVCAMEGARWGALVGRFGESGDPFVIGSRAAIVAEVSGRLMLAVNDYEGYWFDNSGGYAVRILQSQHP